MKPGIACVSSSDSSSNVQPNKAREVFNRLSAPAWEASGANFGGTRLAESLRDGGNLPPVMTLIFAAGAMEGAHSTTHRKPQPPERKPGEQGWRPDDSSAKLE